MSFDGKVAVVTGASGGIGAAITEALADHGATVVAVDRIAPPRRRGRTVVEMTADVSCPEAVGAVGDRLRDEIGSPHHLVNAAGFLEMAPVADTDLDRWNTSFSVNTTGVFLMTKMAVGLMRAGEVGGSIVTVASNAARVPRANMAAYAASKAAAVMFTRCMALEVAGEGIRCNTVSPGSTDTPMLRASWSGLDRSEVTLDGDIGSYRVGIPLRRIATVGDVTDGVLFLLSDSARHITMHDLVIDGGASL